LHHFELNKFLNCINAWFD